MRTSKSRRLLDQRNREDGATCLHRNLAISSVTDRAVWHHELSKCRLNFRHTHLVIGTSYADEAAL
jgi:hypothetical protein